jgi:hypothetical protein
MTDDMRLRNLSLSTQNYLHYVTLRDPSATLLDGVIKPLFGPWNPGTVGV